MTTNNVDEWKRRYFAKHGELPSAEAEAKRAAAQSAFDAKEHKMIDLVTGEPRGKKSKCENCGDVTKGEKFCGMCREMGCQ